LTTFAIFLYRKHITVLDDFKVDFRLRFRLQEREQGNDHVGMRSLIILLYYYKKVFLSVWSGLIIFSPGNGTYIAKRTSKNPSLIAYKYSIYPSG